MNHRVTGGGGVDLQVLEAGDAHAPPLLFVHGYCQSAYAWRVQFAGDLAHDFRLIAFDLRGHGDSEKPDAPEAYTDSRMWADDLAAVIEALQLDHPVLIGWSYAGFVIGDYLRFYGNENIGAINFVSAVTVKGGEKARAFGGPRFAALFPALFSADRATLEPVLGEFADLCVARPLDAATKLEHIRLTASTPAVAREWMHRGRKLDNDDVLSRLDIPVLVTHGAQDEIVLLASSEHNARVIPGARLSIYPGVGHTPFAENPERFERELRALAASA